MCVLCVYVDLDISDVVLGLWFSLHLLVWTVSSPTLHFPPFLRLHLHRFRGHFDKS